MLDDETTHDVTGGHQAYIHRSMGHRILQLANTTCDKQTARALCARRDYKVATLGIIFIYLFIHLPAFLDTGLRRGNAHERDSGPMRGAIPTQSHNPSRLATPPGLRPLFFSNSDVGSFMSHTNKSLKVL